VAATGTIERLVSFRGRWPGTAAERQAAQYLAQGALRDLGRRADVEPTTVRPAYHLTHAAHAALGVVGAVVSVRSAPLGVVILLLAAVSMFGDLTTRYHLLRLLTPRRRSQNVTSPGGDAEAPVRVVLTAHYDAARSGLIFRRRERPPPRLLRRFARIAGPIDVVFWTLVLSLLLAVLRLPMGDSGLLTALQFAATVPLITATILFIDVALSDVVPGASDNASGVAAVLETARRLDSRPLENVDLWVVLTGAEEGLMLGMRQWLRAHGDELDRRRTMFVNVDSVGAGDVRAVTGEGFVLLEQHDGRLVDLAVAAGAKPHVLRLGTDGVVPLTRGYSSVTICCTDPYGRIPHFHSHTDTPEHVDGQAVERAVEVVEALVRRIDTQLVRTIVPSLEAGRSPSAAGRGAE
jgi:hypothetical protein